MGSIPCNLVINMPWLPVVIDRQVKRSNPCLCANKGKCTVVIATATLSNKPANYVSIGNEHSKDS
jgi:hypothetical protein